MHFCQLHFNTSQPFTSIFLSNTLHLPMRQRGAGVTEGCWQRICYKHYNLLGFVLALSARLIGKIKIFSCYLSTLLSINFIESISGLVKNMCNMETDRLLVVHAYEPPSLAVYPYARKCHKLRPKLQLIYHALG